MFGYCIKLALLASLQLFTAPVPVPTNFYSPGHYPDDPGLAPFMGHISFRNICNHRVDQNTNYFDPDTVQQGDVIYLNTWFLEWWTETIHDQIKHPYILITTDVGSWLPHPNIQKLLYDPKLAAWFCRNMVFSYHPKLFQIPMGQDVHLFDGPRAAFHALLEVHKDKHLYPKEHLLYSNFFRRDHGDRDKIGRFFDTKSFCYTAPGTASKHFYQTLASSQFTLSPWGYESDCVRTWEAIVLGCIPIVEHSFLDPLLADLPILIVHDWTEITPALLEQKYEELKDLNRDKAYFKYWETLIQDTQTKVRNNDLAFTQLDATLFSNEDITTILSILQGSFGPLIYKGFLSTLRPFQLSRFIPFPIILYDSWFSPRTYWDINGKRPLGRSVFLMKSEQEFSGHIASGAPTSVFLDFTYYRTSLTHTFHTSTCPLGNFRHSLKPDLEMLYDSLAFGSLLFGNMADEPYVKKVLNLFAQEHEVQIAKHGSFWSLIKAPPSTIHQPIPAPYLATMLPLQLPHCDPNPFLDHLIQSSDITNVVLIGNPSHAMHLTELIPPEGKVFVVHPWNDDQYVQFASNAIHTGLADRIIPLKLDPLEGCKTIQKSGTPIDLIYLEGLKGHFSVLQTLQIWCRLVKQRGMVCGDGWNTSEVRRDIIQFASRNNQLLLNENDFWRFW